MLYIDAYIYKIGNMSSNRFAKAVELATRLHDGQVRKGTSIPYIAHPIAVASLVIEYGGTEDESIAALLHDTVEDCGGTSVLNEIIAQFGDNVATIVDGCTETLVTPKPPWIERKNKYISHMKTASPSVRLVACADKIHNIRSLNIDYRKEGESVWERFRGNKQETLWFYQKVLQALKDAGEDRPIIIDLEKEVMELSLAIGMTSGDGDKKKRSKRKCPNCGSNNIMPIVYGLIQGEDAIKQIEDRDFSAGGCCVDKDSPKWRCRECEKEFGRVGLY